MLKQLHIKNYALIDEIEIKFENGFSVITGETGAGKSIIFGAIGLITGNRAETTVIRDKEKKSVVEAKFDISKLNISSFFKDNDLDFEEECIIRREISPTGKSRAFINDTPTTLNELKELSNLIIDIHTQHDTLSILSKDFQLQLLDSNLPSPELLKKFSHAYTNYKYDITKLNALKEQELKLKQEEDYFRFQLNEFENIDLSIINQEELEEELRILNSAEEIKTTLLTSNQIIENEQGVIDSLKQLNIVISKIGSTSKRLHEVHDRIKGLLIEINDISSELSLIDDDVVFDQERITEINDILNKVYALQSKHHVQSVEELILLKAEFELKVSTVDSLGDEIVSLEKEILSQKNNCIEIAKKISTERNNIKSEIENDFNNTLQELSMSNAQVLFEISDCELTKSGINQVELLFKSNLGTNFSSLKKIASGGELSRLMIAAKNNLSRVKTLPTLFFDEIDAGVSGEVAAKIGELLKKISKTTQVISISHLPQVAGKANHHFFVSKNTDELSTSSSIKLLLEKERIIELAKMLSGEKLTDAAIENAKVLLN